MIDNIASLLKGIIDEENKKLNNYDLKHGPTIGKMYEGLTTKILKKSIPKSIMLKFVNGIIFNDDNQMTGEIDCMIVTGDGENIPYTDSYKWHIKNVIAVVEVKKTLYKDDLIDSFEHLRSVQDNYTSYVQSKNYNKTIDISTALRAFSESTGIHAPEYKDSHKLTTEQKIVYNTFITEQHSPIRIVLGYNGYKSEYNFRETFVNYLEDNLYTKGYNITYFPQIIISGKYSLVKMNGQPFNTVQQNGCWDFYVSSQTNPILLLLEILWTKIARSYNLDENWGNDLVRETFTPFLCAKVVKLNNNYAWDCKYIDVNNKILKAKSEKTIWEPTYITHNQFIIFENLCRGIEVYTNDVELLNYLKKEDEDISKFFNSLVQTGLIAIDQNKKLNLTTKECQCVILNNGKFAVAENDTGLFSRWIFKQQPNLKT